MRRRVAIGLSLLAAAGASLAQESRLHPDVPLLDAGGRPVLESGEPVSPRRSCQGCHDTAWIEEHGYHARAGLDAWGRGARPWDLSPGPYGRWEPTYYRRLTEGSEARFDLGLAEWLQTAGQRHPGGGPARVARDGTPLEQLAPGQAPTLEGHRLDPASGRPVPWDWRASGAAELDCFLCHSAGADAGARRAELAAGRFRWAATATLAGTGLVRREGERWRWQGEAFGEGGLASRARLRLGRPRSEQCGVCHGRVQLGGEPLDLPDLREGWTTRTQGLVYSSQRPADSALNLAGKEQATAPWDAHAARLLECSDCHVSLNDPGARFAPPPERLEHLKVEARRLSPGEFLARPSHDLAKGDTSQGTTARHLAGSMRGCSDCHDAAGHARWLPYTPRHLQRLSCEACHVPRVLLPARAETDASLLDRAGEPLVRLRGAAGQADDPNQLLPGWTPVLLPRAGDGRLVPCNLVTTTYWVAGDPARPVRLHDLRAALLEGGDYRPEVLAALDRDGDGALGPEELRLDDPAQVAAVAARLEAVGVASPRLAAEVQPYELHHGIQRAGVRACGECHTRSGRLGAPFPLLAGGAAPTPTLVPDARVALAGELLRDGDGALVLAPEQASLYVLGHDRAGWIDRLGLAGVLLTVLGALGHGGLRWLAARRPGA